MLIIKIFNKSDLQNKIYDVYKEKFGKLCFLNFTLLREIRYKRKK